jgi:hypothetical protein
MPPSIITGKGSAFAQNKRIRIEQTKYLYERFSMKYTKTEMVCLQTITLYYIYGLIFHFTLWNSGDKHEVSLHY